MEWQGERERGRKTGRESKAGGETKVLLSKENRVNENVKTGVQYISCTQRSQDNSVSAFFIFHFFSFPSSTTTMSTVVESQAGGGGGAPINTAPAPVENDYEDDFDAGNDAYDDDFDEPEGGEIEKEAPVKSTESSTPTSTTSSSPPASSTTPTTVKKEEVEKDDDGYGDSYDDDFDKVSVIEAEPEVKPQQKSPSIPIAEKITTVEPVRKTEEPVARSPRTPAVASNKEIEELTIELDIAKKDTHNANERVKEVEEELQTVREDKKQLMDTNRKLRQQLKVCWMENGRDR